MLPDDEDDFETGPRTPEYHHTADEVESMEVDYSIRGPDDWVISGPLAHGGGPGRRFPSIERADAWVRAKYGARVVHRIIEATLDDRNRWAYLIRGKK